jgi:hypothetical protein
MAPSCGSKRPDDIVETLCAATQPAEVHSIEERARLLEQKKTARREKKRLRRESKP